MNIFQSINLFIKDNQYLTLTVGLLVIVCAYSFLFFRILNKLLTDNKTAMDEFSKKLSKVEEAFLFVVQIRPRLEFLIQNLPLFEKIVELVKTGGVIYDDIDKELQRTHSQLIKLYSGNKIKGSNKKALSIVDTFYRDCVDYISKSNVDQNTKEKLVILISTMKDLLINLVIEIEKMKEHDSVIIHQLISSYIDNVKSIISYFRIEIVSFSKGDSKEKIKENLTKYFEGLTSKYENIDESKNKEEEEKIKNILQGFE